MGRIERDIKKKVKNTKEEYYAWYSKHKEQINQRLDEKSLKIVYFCWYSRHFYCGNYCYSSATNIFYR